MFYKLDRIGRKTTVILEAIHSLTAKGIADASFTKDALIAAGLVEDKHFYDIVNDGWAEGQDGTWYATIYDIQNFDRSFSAVGYVTIELNGETTTVYGVYQSSNARSVAQVAEKLMALEALNGAVDSDTGAWTKAQEAILKGFYA